jgi:hypothetical protein
VLELAWNSERRAKDVCADQQQVDTFNAGNLVDLGERFGRSIMTTTIVAELSALIVSSARNVRNCRWGNPPAMDRCPSGANIAAQL